MMRATSVHRIRRFGQAEARPAVVISPRKPSPKNFYASMFIRRGASVEPPASRRVCRRKAKPRRHEPLSPVARPAIRPAFVPEVTQVDRRRVDKPRVRSVTQAPRFRPSLLPLVIPRALATRPIHGDWKLPQQYVMRGVLGSGAYGEVIEAIDRRCDKRVAIKRMRHIFHSLGDAKRMLREVAILNRVDCRNVVSMLDCFVPHAAFSEIYVVLEFCDSDFGKIAKSSSRLSEEQVTHMIHGMLLGLRYLHSVGIVHRDLKPGNTLVNQNCGVRICDLGMARTVGRPTSTFHEPVKMTKHVATRWYRPPELIFVSDDYDTKVDMWAVGCVLGELLRNVEGSMFPSNRTKALFPGSRCAPLSPGHVEPRDDPRDQMNLIFDIIGTPADRDLEGIQSSRTRRLMKSYAPRSARKWSEVFPWVKNAHLLGLIDSLLAFDPKKRLSAKDALAHPLFDGLEKGKTEKPFTVVLPFNDSKALSESELRTCFLDEVARCERRVREKRDPRRR